MESGTAVQERRTDAPESPTKLSGGSWWAVLKRTVREFREENLTDWAAALTYYGVLAIFPALIVLVSVLGLVGDSATQPLIDNVGKVAPGPAKEIFTNAIENLQGAQGAAGVAFVIGLAVLVGVPTLCLVAGLGREFTAGEIARTALGVSAVLVVAVWVASAIARLRGRES